MEPAVTEGAGLMDRVSASVLPETTSPDLLTVRPTKEYSTIEWGPPNFLQQPVESNEFYPFDPFTALDGPTSLQAAHVAQAATWANWQEIEKVMNFSSTNDDIFRNSGYSGYGSPSRALSVESMHKSISSRSSSNHSWLGWRGRSRIKKLFSRSSSIAGGAKSTMNEGMSSWSLGDATKHFSPSPRRIGKLTDVARAGIRLLKDQGACWKCKILKKSVRKTASDVSLSG
jgi:hypothetical protein